MEAMKKIRDISKYRKLDIGTKIRAFIAYAIVYSYTTVRHGQ